MIFLKNKFSFILSIIFVIITTLFCSGKGGINQYQFPKTIAGQVKNNTGVTLENAKANVPIVLEVEPVFTNARGYF
ncbi:MAG: hypothetical protein ACK4G1_05335 [Ignavibacteria bacterium]